ncbi:MAG: regulatory protein RecX [Odoribacter sp.]
MIPEKALNRAAALCSKKEYCSQEIQEKLILWEIPDQEIAKIMSFLHEHNFLNDTRYAIAYAADKRMLGSWGKLKISLHLRQKGLPSEIIRQALDDLDQEEYSKTCMELLKQKRKQLNEPDPYQEKGKLIRFAIGRGFEYDLIENCLSRLLKGQIDDEPA